MLLVPGTLLSLVALLTAQSAAAPATEIVMSTQSPAEAVQQAIQLDPEVAKAVQGNSTQQLYLLKTVSYTTGTAEDLDLPPESSLPDGAPDRVKETDVAVFSAPTQSTASDSSEKLTATNPSSTMSATLKLVPIALTR